MIPARRFTVQQSGARPQIMAKLRAIKGGRYDEKPAGDYRTKLKKHRAMNMYRTFIFIVLILVVLLIIYARYESHVYTGYEILSTYERSAPDSQRDVRLGHSILTYSHDGAHCVDGSGKTVWDQGYEMQDLRISVCEGTVGLAVPHGLCLLQCGHGHHRIQQPGRLL